MRVRIAAALSAVIVLVFIVGAPVMSVMVGTALAYALLVWMGRGAARPPIAAPRDP